MKAINKNILASRLNDFYKDFDYYDYTDKLNGTEEDTINDLVRQLDDAEAVSGILDALLDIQANGGLSEAQKLVLDELVLDLSEVQVSLGKSVGDVIAEAINRSQTVNADAVTVDILQLKRGDDMWRLRFEPLERLEGGANGVDAKNYDRIYKYVSDAPVSFDNKSGVAGFLEQVYTKFNINHPADFKGHSLSVSDVVVLSKENERKAFFCDSFGFAELPEKFVKDFLISFGKDEAAKDL